MLKIDGSKKEGGGAILRTATALSAITQTPCHVFNIRKGRKKPGLRTQHLLGLRALADLCNGKLENDELKSEEITFKPNEIKGKKISIKIYTAASITLILQSLIPVALFGSGPVEITFKGGATDTFFSPTIDHFQHVFLKILEKMNAKPEINILRRGYYPKGGAKVKVKIEPSKLKGIELTERGKLKKILAISGASRHLKKKKVAERQLAGVREILPKQLSFEEKVNYYQTECPGSNICLIAEFENTIIGTDNLGKLGKRAEDVGKEAALELLKEEKSQACLDKHLADQILVFMALSGASEVTVSKITEHCKTNIWVIEKFLNGKFKIKKNHIEWLPKVVNLD